MLLKNCAKPGAVAVLLATYNGERFLEEQLRSLADQTHPRIDVLVSDDGSTDGTRTILKNWAARWNKGKFSIVTGTGRGFSHNFRSLILTADTSANYFAFCDQDDIWRKRKLEVALNWFDETNDIPQLFCSRTMTIAEDRQPIGLSPLFPHPPSFRNALVQSIAGGNTMVFNRATFDLLSKASARCSFVSHDWWTYLIVAGAGGKIEYCTEPLVYYRQHGANQIGANTSLEARLKRMKRLLSGEFSDWTDRNVDCIARNLDLLTTDAANAFAQFLGTRGGQPWRRLAKLYSSGIYRQTVPGTMALYLATALDRL